MLNQGIKILILTFVFFQSCKNEEDHRHEKIKNAVSKICSQKDYNQIYQNANDSIAIWSLNKLSSYAFEKDKFEYQLDSLLCINKANDRLVSCILERVMVKESNNDGLIYFYGEKINNQWFFFRAGATTVPREMVKGHPIHQPLSYQQLHQIALKEVYGGYLKENGEINEAWFTSHFEGPGWGDFKNQASSDWHLKGKRFKTKKEFFEFVHLEKVQNNWYGVNKDSIKQLPPKTNLP